MPVETALHSPNIAFDLGLLSGTAVAGGQTLEIVELVLDDPGVLIESVTQILTLAKNLGLLDDMLGAVPEDIRHKQALNNPYDESKQWESYTAFQAGYYSSYFVVHAVFFAFGGEASAGARGAVKSAGAFEKTVDALDASGDLARAMKFMSRAKGVMGSPARKARYKLADNVASVSKHAPGPTRRMVGGVRTVGGQVEFEDHLRKVDADTLDGLTGNQQDELRTLLQRTGDDGVRLANDLDDEALDDFLSVRSRAETDGGDSDDYDLADEFRASIARANREGDVSPNEIHEAVQRIERLEGRNHEDALTFVAETDSDGIRAIGGLQSEEELRTLLSITYRGEIDGDSALVDSSLSAADMVEVAEKADLNTIELVVKDQKSGQARWLEMGDAERGWKHISQRHIKGSQNKEPASYFPLGQTVEGRTLPSSMTEIDVKKLIYHSIKYGKRTPGRGQRVYQYYLKPSKSRFPDAGIDEVKVIVEEGSVKTAYPISGDKVRKWIPTLNDGQGGWVNA